MCGLPTNWLRSPSRRQNGKLAPQKLRQHRTGLANSIQPMKFLAALLLSLALPAAAATIEGRVVGVTDGETITVLDHQNVQHRIRIASIDAPERKQPYYSRSKEYLSQWIFNRSVVVESDKRDHYKRIIGQIFLDGHDIGLESAPVATDPSIGSGAYLTDVASSQWLVLQPNVLVCGGPAPTVEPARCWWPVRST